jgi:hypothetical protein
MFRLNAENQIARLKSEKQDLASKAALAAEADRQRSDDDTAVIEWLRKGLEMREAKVKADCAEHQKMLLSASEVRTEYARWCIICCVNRYVAILSECFDLSNVIGFHN